MFINKRGLYEVEIQSKIDEGKGSDIPFTIIKKLGKVLPAEYGELSAQMLSKINPTA